MEYINGIYESNMMLESLSYSYLESDIFDNVDNIEEKSNDSDLHIDVEDEYENKMVLLGNYDYINITGITLVKTDTTVVNNALTFKLIKCSNCEFNICTKMLREFYCPFCKKDLAKSHLTDRFTDLKKC